MWCQEFLNMVLAELERQMKTEPLAMIKAVAEQTPPSQPLRINRLKGVPTTLFDLSQDLGRAKKNFVDLIADSKEEAKWANSPLIIPTTGGKWGGCRQDILAARSLVTRPIIRRDVILTEYQVFQSRALGADSFTLFAGLFDLAKLQYLIEVGRDLGMEPLIYVTNCDEMSVALDSDGEFIVITSPLIGAPTSLNPQPMLNQVKLTGEERSLILDTRFPMAKPIDSKENRLLSGIIMEQGISCSENLENRYNHGQSVTITEDGDLERR